jgi:hypothetical protein
MIWYGIESLDFGGLYHTTLDGFGGTILQCSFQGLEGTIQLLNVIGSSSPSTSQPIHIESISSDSRPNSVIVSNIPFQSLG